MKAYAKLSFAALITSSLIACGGDSSSDTQQEDPIGLYSVPEAPISASVLKEYTPESLQLFSSETPEGIWLLTTSNLSGDVFLSEGNELRHADHWIGQSLVRIENTSEGLRLYNCNTNTDIDFSTIRLEKDKAAYKSEVFIMNDDQQLDANVSLYFKDNISLEGQYFNYLSTHHNIRISKTFVYGVKVSEASSIAGAQELNVSYRIADGTTDLNSDSNTLTPDCISTHFVNGKISGEGVHLDYAGMTATILQGDNEASVLDISLSEEYLNSGYLIDIAAGNGIHLSGNRECDEETDSDINCTVTPSINFDQASLGQNGFNFNIRLKHEDTDIQMEASVVIP